LKFPKHEASLTLQHNDHKNVYQSAFDWIDEYHQHYQWKDEEAKQRAIETDSIWTLQWYPITPIGFFAVAAPTLEEVLAMAQEVESQ